MLHLKLEDLCNKESFEQKQIRVPAYDIARMREETKKNPIWLHFGGGNIFRGFIASLQQRLLECKKAECGIIVADTFDFDMIDQIYTGFDNLTLSVGLKADGTTEKEIVASVAEALKADCNDKEQFGRLLAVAGDKSLQMMSFTITEKGYALYGMNGELLPVVAEDYAKGPECAKHAISVVTALLWERYLKGGAPIALVSMDNCSHNGEKLEKAVLTIASEWQKRGFVSEEFVAYISDRTRVTFPWSMIDKITPRPAGEIRQMLTMLDIADMDPIVTNRNTYIAPFVNAEILQYLVIEDDFPNNRPVLELAGVYMTDRDTVNKTEKMKVTTCLNPLHTAMAVFGCLLGYTHIAKEMQDEDIKALVNLIGYKEGLPVVTNPGIIDPSEFIREVLKERLPNMFLPDMPQRIATDTSMKIPIRFGETMKSYVAATDKSITDLTGIPLAIAAWFRYLLGVDDLLQPMEVSTDPLKDELQARLQGIEVGKPETYRGQLLEILSMESIFGLNLCTSGLAPKIEELFKQMLTGPNAVRKTLHDTVSEV